MAAKTSISHFKALKARFGNKAHLIASNGGKNIKFRCGWTITVVTAAQRMVTPNPTQAVSYCPNCTHGLTN